jgi:predicted nucleotidyltransferase component of viral defense system
MDAEALAPSRRRVGQMNTFARLPPSERQPYFIQAADELKLPPQLIEKDFWVCWTLQRLFNLHDIGPHLTFKGGTSLSKVYHLIDRFSEDIDITISRDFLGFGGEKDPATAPSKSKRKERLEALKQKCGHYIETKLKAALEQDIAGNLGAGAPFHLRLDDKDPDHQTLLFAYPGCWQTNTGGYVESEVKIEMGARSDIWPNQRGTVKPYVAEQFPKAFSSQECQVQVLAAERTFWEKAALLHEENLRPAGKPLKPRMSRHYFDVFKLIEAGIADRAMSAAGLFESVVDHRAVFFNYTWVKYEDFKRGSLLLVPKPERFAEWKADYMRMQQMVFRPTLNFDAIIQKVREFQDRFNAG